MDRSSLVYTVIIYTVVILVTLIETYPLYFSVIASFSDPDAVALGDTIRWFKGFTTDAYKAILKETMLITGYKNSFVYMILGTAFSLALTIPAGYVCSKTFIPGHRFILWYFFLTMYVAGGTVPTYLWFRDLGLVNNPLVMVVSTGVNAFYLIS